MHKVRPMHEVWFSTADLSWRTQMVESSASRRYSQRLGESCWSSAVEKPRTAFQIYSVGMFAMIAVEACGSGRSKFEESGKV